MITDEELVAAGRALADRFGTERATAFATALPMAVAGLVEQWGLVVGQCLPSGATSVVLAVDDRTGAPAVLKLSPDGDFLARQVTMLEHLAPTGRVPAVLERDTLLGQDTLRQQNRLPELAGAPGAVLLERVIPGVTLDDSRSTPPTPSEWAGLLDDLHGTPTRAVPDQLRQRCEDMFRRIGARQASERVRAHVPRELWRHAVEECLSLLETDHEQRVIHGDLHLGNVLRSEQHGLVVIDPKLCVGDRCFDMVDFVVTTGTADQMVARARELAPLVGVETDRLLRWSRVNAVVTAISRIAGTGPSEWTQTLLKFSRRR